jgi:hypothetical protein
VPVKLSWKLLPLALGGLVTTVIAALVVVYILTAWWSKPIFGFGAGGPDQPIAFPHTVHVDQAGIQCEFCHRNVSKGAAATVPAVEQCLFCHTTVNGEPSQGLQNPEIVKLLAHGGLGPDGMEDPALVPGPIEWERVHRVPDHVQFFHEPHIRYFTQTNAGQAEAMQRARDNSLPMSSPPQPTELVEATCTICHGKVRAMEKVKQERRLKMGDCVDCHRDNDGPTDCVTCHY